MEKEKPLEERIDEFMSKEFVLINKLYEFCHSLDNIKKDNSNTNSNLKSFRKTNQKIVDFYWKEFFENSISMLKTCIDEGASDYARLYFDNVINNHVFNPQIRNLSSPIRDEEVKKYFEFGVKKLGLKTREEQMSLHKKLEEDAAIEEYNFNNISNKLHKLRICDGYMDVLDKDFDKKYGRENKGIENYLKSAVEDCRSATIKLCKRDNLKLAKEAYGYGLTPFIGKKYLYTLTIAEEGLKYLKFGERKFGLDYSKEIAEIKEDIFNFKKQLRGGKK